MSTLSNFTVGITGEATVKVTESNTAQALGSGSLLLFGTPALLALAESAACKAIEDSLVEGETSVGSKVELTHTSPTPIGCTVTATARLIHINSRLLTFSISVTDSSGVLVGTCTHVRAIVVRDQIMTKANAKL